MIFTSAEVKLRILAIQYPALQAALGGSDPNSFRWWNRRLQQNEIGKLVANGACVRVTRVGTIRTSNQGGLMPLSQPRIQIDVLDLDSETARSVANDVANFMDQVDLVSDAQFTSPVGTINQNPCFLLNQRAGMIPNPASPAGPIYVESLDYRIFNSEDISI